jgi:hypothetical protein
VARTSAEPEWVTRRRRELFHTTKPEESAIAPAATSGFKKPKAARGMAVAL